MSYAADDVVAVEYVDPSGKTYLRHPETNAPLEHGEVFHAPWLWVRQRWPHHRAGMLKVLGPAETAPDATCAGVKANGEPCGAKPKDGERYCRHHKGQAQ